MKKFIQSLLCSSFVFGFFYVPNLGHAKEIIVKEVQDSRPSVVYDFYTVEEKMRDQLAAEHQNSEQSLVDALTTPRLEEKAHEANPLPTIKNACDRYEEECANELGSYESSTEALYCLGLARECKLINFGKKDPPHGYEGND